MKKRIVSLLLSLLLLISVVPISVSAEGNYVAWIGTKGYETLDAAIKDAQDGDTIQWEKVTMQHILRKVNPITVERT